MGGYGSGRGTNTKSITNAYLEMDVRRWHRGGWLHSGNSFVSEWTCNDKTIATMKVNTGPNHLVLVYRNIGNDGLPKNLQYAVSIAWTPCNYGGLRPWFICPTEDCGRRVAILYRGEVFACRKCHQLVYGSQRQADWERAITKAQKIRMRLGGSPNLTDVFPYRPKGMHESTYERLRQKESIANASSYPSFLREPLVQTKI
jgi:hypothetical protein